MVLRGLILLTLACPAAAEVRLVVAVGNDYGLVNETPLRHAATDAARLAETFSQVGRTAIDDILLVQNEGPEGFMAALVEVSARAAKHRPDQVSVIVYFSGHGDETHLHLEGERLSVQTVEAAVRAIPAGVRLIVLDACRSRSGRAKGLQASQPFDIAVKGASGPRGVVTVRSSSDGEAAQESDQLKGSIFTHYLVSALRGAADRNQDHQVTFSEAYEYSFGRTLRRSARGPGSLQHPSADLQIQGAGPLVLTWTAEANSLLVLPPGRDMQYVVFQLPTATAVAEAWSPSNRAVELALPPGRFLVQRRGEGLYGAAEVALPYGGRRTLAAGDFTAIPADAIARKGGAMVVKRHEVAAGYGMSLQRFGGLGQQVQLGYGLRFVSWAVTADAEIGAVRYDTDVSRVDERWAGGRLMAWIREPVGPLELRAGAGGGLRLLQRDEARARGALLAAAGYDANRTQNGTLYGPVAAIDARLPLVADIWWRLGGAGAWWFADGDDPGWAATVDTGVGWIF